MKPLPALTPQQIDMFWAHVVRGDGCWEWRGTKDRDGYGLFYYAYLKRARAHRIAFALTSGQIDNPHFVLHRCDNPPCINPSHLFAGTAADNVKDMIAKGRGRGARKGAAHHSAKLTESDVRSAREERASGVSLAELAQKYGVSISVIRDAVLRISWQNVA